jgi:hypothetical protein
MMAVPRLRAGLMLVPLQQQQQHHYHHHRAGDQRTVNNNTVDQFVKKFRSIIYIFPINQNFQIRVVSNIS